MILTFRSKLSFTGVREKAWFLSITSGDI